VTNTPPSQPERDAELEIAWREHEDLARADWTHRQPSSVVSHRAKVEAAIRAAERGPLVEALRAIVKLREDDEQFKYPFMSTESGRRIGWEDAAIIARRALLSIPEGEA
jgi:hypothetical protein